MKKKLTSILLSCAIAITGVSTGLSVTPAKAATEATVDKDTPITDIPLFSSVYEFRKYVDNNDTPDNPRYAVQEYLEKDGEYGGVHKFTAPEDGTLVFYTFGTDDFGGSDGRVYSDPTLTEDSCLVHTGANSTRDDIGQTEVKKNTTYYFLQTNWNASRATVTSYLGLIPSSSSITVPPQETVYNRENNIEIKQVADVAEFKEKLETMKVAEDASEVEGSVSKTYSFSVEEAGWLLLHPYRTGGYMEIHLFTDASLSSRLGKYYTEKADDDPKMVWLDPGTYYFYAYDWLGSGNIPITTYLGFIGVSQYISVESSKLSADKTTCDVTFKADKAGSIRVISGDADPAIIKENGEKYWNTDNRVNMLTGKTYTASANGNYAARFQDNATGIYYMIPFTVSGIVPAATDNNADNNANNNNTNTTEDKTTADNNTSATNLKKVTFKNTSKTFKYKKIKKKAASYSIIKKSGGGKVTYKVTKGKKKYVKVSAKGKVTVKKGAKKGTYKVKVTVAKKGSYKKTSTTIKIKIK